MNISIVGLGYVGLSLSVLLSRNYNVVSTDIDKKKIRKIKNKVSPILDKDIETFLKSKKLNLKVTSNKRTCFKGATYTIVAVPTDYNKKSNSFNTKIVENTISEILEIEPKTTIVIKSTVPHGFTDHIRKKYKIKNIFYSPEFLRESKALHDNLYPSRIIIGEKSNEAKIFAKILKKCAVKKNTKVYFMSSREAEATKLFSNTYLAMRISFFNELDTFSEANELDSEKIINGVCSDPRVGNYYNNPSFGYGGYCLPKDTQQLLKNYKKIPNNIISGIVNANKTRKDFITNQILKKNPKSVGIYRLIMKSGSDNFRDSAILDIINNLISRGIDLYVYEPLMNKKNKFSFQIQNNLDKFIKISDVIIANRSSSEIDHVINKVYTRDIFKEN